MASESRKRLRAHRAKLKKRRKERKQEEAEHQRRVILAQLGRREDETEDVASGKGATLQSKEEPKAEAQPAPKQEEPPKPPTSQPAPERPSGQQLVKELRDKGFSGKELAEALKKVRSGELSLDRPEQLEEFKKRGGDILTSKAKKEKEKARVKELKDKGEAEDAEAKRRGISVNQLRKEQDEAARQAELAERQEKAIKAGTAVGTGTNRLTVEEAKIRQDIRAGRATQAQKERQQELYAQRLEERVAKLSLAQATPKNIARIVDEEAARRGLIADAKTRERYATQKAIERQQQSLPNGGFDPGLAASSEAARQKGFERAIEERIAALDGSLSQNRLATEIRDIVKEEADRHNLEVTDIAAVSYAQRQAENVRAATRLAETGAVSQTQAQRQYDTAVDRAVADILSKPGRKDVRTEVASAMRRIAAEQGVEVDRAAISRFATSIALNDAAGQPVNFSREIGVSVPPAVTRFNAEIDRKMKALVADSEGQNLDTVRSKAAKILRDEAEELGLEIEDREVSRFAGAVAEALAANQIPDLSRESVTPATRRRIISGVVSGELSMDALDDLDPETQGRLIQISGLPVSGATFDQLNRELEKAQKAKGQATFLDRVQNAAIIDEARELGGGLGGGRSDLLTRPGSPAEQLDSFKDSLKMSREQEKAAKQLLEDTTRTVKAAASHGEYLNFLAQTGQHDRLRKEFNDSPASDADLQRLDAELRQQSAQEILDAAKIGAMGAASMARQPFTLSEAFGQLSGSTKGALRRANLPATSRQLLTRTKEITAGGASKFKSEVMRLAEEYGGSATLGSGPVPPNLFKLPKLNVKLKGKTTPKKGTKADIEGAPEFKGEVPPREGPTPAGKGKAAPKQEATPDEPLPGGEGGVATIAPPKPTVKPQTGTKKPITKQPDTATKTKTDTATKTATKPKADTATKTQTATKTKTGTKTEAATKTATETKTSTKTATQTKTATKVKTVAPPKTKTKVASKTATKTKVATKTALATKTKTVTATDVAVATKTAVAVGTKTATATKTKTAVGTDTPTTTKTKVATGTLKHTGTAAAVATDVDTDTATQVGTKPAVGTQTDVATDTDVVVGTTTGTGVEVGTGVGVSTPTTTPVATTTPTATTTTPTVTTPAVTTTPTVTTTTPDVEAPPDTKTPVRVRVEVPTRLPPRIRKPEIDEESGEIKVRLPKDQYIETIAWRQGAVFHAKNLVTGDGAADDEPIFGVVSDKKGLSPQESLRIVSVSPKIPKEQTIDMGVVDLHIRPSRGKVSLQFRPDRAVVRASKAKSSGRRFKGRPKVVTQNGATLVNNRRGVKRAKNSRRS